jgi:hypothetical protein
MNQLLSTDLSRINNKWYYKISVGFVTLAPCIIGKITAILYEPCGLRSSNMLWVSKLHLAIHYRKSGIRKTIKINGYFSLTTFSFPYIESLHCELFHVISGCQKVRGGKCSLKLEVVVLVAGHTQHNEECNDQRSENPPMYSEPLLDLRSTGELFGTPIRITWSCSHGLAWDPGPVEV